MYMNKFGVYAIAAKSARNEMIPTGSIPGFFTPNNNHKNMMKF